MIIDYYYPSEKNLKVPEGKFPGVAFEVEKKKRRTVRRQNGVNTRTTN